MAKPRSPRNEPPEPPEHPADIALLLHSRISLPDAEDAELRRHLEDCLRCQERLYELEYLDSEGDLAVEEPFDAEDVTPEVRAALARDLAESLEQVNAEMVRRGGEPSYPFAAGFNPASGVAKHLVEALECWVNYARTADGGDERHLDGFWRPLLCGEAARAAISADDDQLASLGHLLRELAVFAPSGCHGSRERVSRWRGLANQGVKP